MRPDDFQSQVPFDPDDVVDRATQTLREMPIPRGPSPELIGRMQAALRRARPGFAVQQSWFLRPAFFRVAALVAIVAGGAIGHWVFLNGHDANRQHPIARVNIGKPGATKSPIVSRPQSPQDSAIPSPAPVAVKTPERHATPSTPPASLLADGILTGRIVFDGVAPAPKQLLGFAMTPECAKQHGGAIYDESLVVAPGGALANVVVSISDGLSGWLPEEYPPPPPAVLDQKGCTFVPHVVAVMVGQQLSIKNSDPFLHNVHVLAVNNPPANLGQPSTSEADTAPFESPEVFRVRCDVHPWMQAWVRVLDNPFFAVTGSDGRFTIRGLPPGTYTLKAWHEQLGVEEQQIVVTPGEGTDADFTFHARPG